MGVFDRIITDLAVLDVMPDRLALVEAVDGVGKNELHTKTCVSFRRV